MNDNHPASDDETAVRMVPIIGDVREGAVIFRRNGYDLLELRRTQQGESFGALDSES